MTGERDNDRGVISGVHGESRHELYLMCDDIHATLAELRGKGVPIARDVSDQGWGLVAAIRLPDGEEFPIYEPRHPSLIRTGGGGLRRAGPGCGRRCRGAPRPGRRR